MNYRKITLSLILTVLLLTSATPIFAQRAAAPGLLPPLPQWPIIGPILQWLGVAEEPEPVEMPLRDLPEYTIETLEDVKALQDIETGQSVRIRAKDTDLNILLAEASASIDGIDRATVQFEEGAVSGNVTLDRDLLAQVNAELPPIGGESLQIMSTVEPSVEACQVTVKVKKFKINNLGLRLLLGSVVNQVIADNWPEEICAEAIVVKPGEIVVEGYRK